LLRCSITDFECAHRDNLTAHEAFTMQWLSGAATSRSELERSTTADQSLCQPDSMEQTRQTCLKKTLNTMT
jgi:hypothetical protein